MKEIEQIDIGDAVVCDLCNADYTNSDQQGGFVIDNHAICPECAPGHLETVRKYDEEKYIQAWCPGGLSFKDFVLGVRAGNNTISIETSDDPLTDPF